MAPTTPMAPASVGVASPMKIVPNTRKISPSDGIMPRRHFFHSAHPFKVRASIGKAGTALGQMMLTMATHTQNKATWMMLGPMAPAYMSPTERPSTSASTTNTSDGGINCVMVPEAAMTPMVCDRESPYLSIGVIE